MAEHRLLWALGRDHGDSGGSRKRLGLLHGGRGRPTAGILPGERAGGLSFHCSLTVMMSLGSPASPLRKL